MRTATLVLAALLSTSAMAQDALNIECLPSENLVNYQGIQKLTLSVPSEDRNALMQVEFSTGEIYPANMTGTGAAEIEVFTPTSEEERGYTVTLQHMGTEVSGAAAYRAIVQQGEDTNTQSWLSCRPKK